MQRKPVLLFVNRKVISPLKEFFNDSRAVGIILLCCTVISIILSNSGWSEPYTNFWNMEWHIPIAALHLPHTPLHTINDLLMAVFFLLVGVEIKRELLVGELSSIKKSLLPVIAALGGMIVPAILYLVGAGNGEVLHKGWGIPMATDIAFSLAVLSMLGNKVSFSLRVFLMALAIIDDLGGIITIAVFYAEKIDLQYLAATGGIMLLLTVMNLLKVKRYFLYMIPGIVLWYCAFNSGVHATIAGVLLAFTIPLHKVEQLEHTLHDPVNFIILPLFALANTAIVLPDEYGSVFTSGAFYGIMAGLVLGKPLGIFLFSRLAVKMKIANLPRGMRWSEVLGMGVVAGIGFTISIFMSTLAFKDNNLQTTAKVAVIIASLVSGVGGYIYLRFQHKALPQRKGELL